MYKKIYSEIKKEKFLTAVAFITALSSIIILTSCTGSGRKNNTPTPPELIVTNPTSNGFEIQLEFFKGINHNHPLMAVWSETTEGKYIETLYVAESIAKGMYKHGDNKTGKWLPGPIRRPATLPYWAHKRGVKEEDGLFIPTFLTPMPDAITGPTPKGNFILEAKTTKEYPETFNVLFEINQSWDWNEYWTNGKFPDDKEYKTSSQPSVIYKATLQKSKSKETYQLIAIGHGHYSGANGELFTDLNTLTTALKIADKILVKIK